MLKLKYFYFKSYIKYDILKNQNRGRDRRRKEKVLFITFHDIFFQLLELGSLHFQCAPILTNNVVIPEYEEGI